MTKRLAIIPARGGSKRIHQKNIIDFLGRPMITWTIKAALDSECFDQVLVSTDCSEISNVSIDSGASVPFLREENMDDFAPVSQASISALKQAENHWQCRFDQVVQLMPNCPLRQAEDIKKAVDHFEEQSSDYQISCFRFGWMNPWWAMQLGQYGTPLPLFEEKTKQRSQDLPPLYCPTGAIWIAGRDKLIDAGSFYGPDHRFFPMDWKSAVDIDDAEDLEMARHIASMRHGEAR